MAGPGMGGAVFLLDLRIYWSRKNLPVVSPQTISVTGGGAAALSGNHAVSLPCAQGWTDFSLSTQDTAGQVYVGGAHEAFLFTVVIIGGTLKCALHAGL